jgi:UMF1 family MFS transporter
LSLVVIQKPEILGFAGAASAARACFVVVAVWWLVFSLPLLRKVPEPPLQGGSNQGWSQIVVGAVGRLGETFRELRRFRQAFLLMLAVMIYNDGIGTIIRMATIYGAEIGLPEGSLIAAILLVQFLGIPFAFLFGALSGWIGPKRSILLGLSVYLGISVLGYYMKTVLHFYVLAALVAMVQGGTQALSRSLFATLIPRRKSSEFFGFFAVFEKFAGTLGPLVFFWVIQLTGSSRVAVLAVIAFFVVGGGLLLGVNVEEGRIEARRAEGKEVL